LETRATAAHAKTHKETPLTADVVGQRVALGLAFRELLIIDHIPNIQLPLLLGEGRSRALSVQLMSYHAFLIHLLMLEHFLNIYFLY